MNPSRTAIRWLTAAAVVAAAVVAHPAAQTGDDFVPVTDAMLADPADGDWLMWRRTLDGWGFRCECAVKS
jgi:alcohol dehydrogenase (cytochrome c)